MSGSVGKVGDENGSQAASLTRLAGCQPAESAKLATANPSCGGLADIRSEQRSGKSSLADDPIALFQTWFREAIDSGIEEPSAMTVATVDPDGSSGRANDVAQGRGRARVRFLHESGKRKGARADA